MWLVSEWIIARLKGYDEQQMAELLERFWSSMDIRYALGILELPRRCETVSEGKEWWW